MACWQFPMHDWLSNPPFLDRGLTEFCKWNYFWYCRFHPLWREHSSYTIITFITPYLNLNPSLLLRLLKESHLSSITLSELPHSCFKLLYCGILSLKALLEVCFKLLYCVILSLEALLEVQYHCDRQENILVNTITTLRHYHFYSNAHASFHRPANSFTGDELEPSKSHTLAADYIILTSMCYYYVTKYVQCGSGMFKVGSTALAKSRNFAHE